MIPLLLLLLQAPVAPQPDELPGARPYVYKETPQGELRLHVFTPSQAPEKSPAIVFFFGGGWRAGTIKQFVPHSQHLASRGMVAIVADYRVSGRHKTTPAEAIADAKSALRWVREHADELGVDPTRVVAAGGSAGGHLAAATALVPGFEDETHGDAQPNALLLFNPVVLVPERFSELSAKISPLTYVRKGVPPALIFHGAADTTVPISTVHEFCKQMTAVGNKCKVESTPDATHGFFNRSPHLEQTMERMDRFLTELGYLPRRS
jgi:acetyl esterase/lipase